MNAQFALTVLRNSRAFKEIGTETSEYYRGRVIAQQTMRHEVLPNLNGNHEVLGFMEYVLEHSNDEPASTN